jgi:hypothetical protein
MQLGEGVDGYKSDFTHVTQFHILQLAMRRNGCLEDVAAAADTLSNSNRVNHLSDWNATADISRSRLAVKQINSFTTSVHQAVQCGLYKALAVVSNAWGKQGGHYE